MAESEARRTFPDRFASPAPPKASTKGLARRVLSEIDAVAVPKTHPKPSGAPRPPKWVVDRLAEMRAALVEPYRLSVAGGRALQDRVASRDFEIVADNGAALVAFDPSPEGDFVVVWRRPSGLTLSNIRGGAVDCFLAI